MTTKRRYGKEELARRGQTLYEKDMLSTLTANDDGRFAAIDIESGACEIDRDKLAACDQLRARLRDGQIWMVRVDSR